MDPLRPGDPERIGPFRLRGRLGAGGMGEVFLAASPGGRDVVVKVVRPELADAPAARRRFAREIEAVRRVGGFHTAQVVDAAPDADPPWMAAEYIPGPSLRDLVRERGPLPPEEVRTLAGHLCEGLAVIHAASMVHRDLKPSNVIMAADGARIIDFGIAHLVDASSVLTETGAVVGTFAFMSPEQLQGADVRPACDVFSLGSVLTFAATGKGPFDAPTIPAMALRIVTAEPDLGTLQGELRDLVLACLAKDPIDRPTAKDLLDRLSGEGEAPAFRTPPPQPSPPPQAPPSPRPSPTPPSSSPPPPPATPPIPPPRPSSAPSGPAPSPPRRQGSVARRRVLLAGMGMGAAAAVAVPAAVLVARGSGANAGAGPRFFDREQGAPAASTPSARRVFTGLLRGHFGAVDQVRFSPNGAFVATSGADGLVMLWDAASGKRLRQIRGHVHPPVALAFSQDSKALITGAESVRVWDVATGREARVITDRSPGGRAGLRLAAMAVSRNGRYLATTEGDGRVVLWDAADGLVIRTFSSDADSALAFTPDGRWLVGGGRTLRIWDVATGRPLRSIETSLENIQAVAVSPDGRLLAASDDISPVNVWAVASGRLLHTLRDRGDSSGAIAFSPDSRYLAGVPDERKPDAEKITLWDMATGGISRSLPRGHSRAVRALSFHPTGTVLASASQDGTARLWRLF